jgi:hypothetical protein
MFTLQGAASIAISALVLIFILWLASVILAFVGLGGTIATLVYVVIVLLWLVGLVRYLGFNVGPPPA